MWWFGLKLSGGGAARTVPQREMNRRSTKSYASRRRCTQSPACAAITEQRLHLLPRSQMTSMLQQLPAALLDEILSFLTAVQSFALLRSSRDLGIAVRAAAANTGRLMRRQRAGRPDDAIQRFLVHSKQPGDRIRLFTNTPYIAVVAVRLVGGWRLDFLDGRGRKRASMQTSQNPWRSCISCITSCAFEVQ